LKIITTKPEPETSGEKTGHNNGQDKGRAFGAGHKTPFSLKRV
jgi:hypothetical protein